MVRTIPEIFHEPNRTYLRVFDKDPQKLSEMLSRYAKGEELTALGRAYGVDHTSILHQVKKAGIWQKLEKKKVTPPRRSAVARSQPEKPKAKVYIYQARFDQEDKRCPGKFYREYVEEAAARMSVKFKNCGPFRVGPRKKLRA